MNQKLRAWSKDYGMLELGDIDSHGIRWGSSSSCRFELSITLHCTETNNNEDPTPTWEELVWMRYTGLKDKNGKMIWEGDIVKHQQQVFDEFGEHTAKVFYKAPSFMIENISGNLSGLWALPEQYAIDCHQTFEVIGNEWENPDLLK